MNALVERLLSPPPSPNVFLAEALRSFSPRRQIHPYDFMKSFFKKSNFLANLFASVVKYGIDELECGKYGSADKQSHGSTNVTEQGVKSVRLSVMDNLSAFVGEEEFQENDVFFHELGVGDARLREPMHVLLYFGQPEMYCVMRNYACVY